MRQQPRPFDVVHVSSAHPWTDPRIHLRQAASIAAAGYRTALIAVATPGEPEDQDWSAPDPRTGVYVRRVRARSRGARVLISTVQVVGAALASRAAVVHLHDPELLWSVGLFRALGRAVVYDAHEDLVEQIRGKHYLSAASRCVARAIASVALRTLVAADAVVAATPTIARRVSHRRVVVVRNLPRIRAQDVDVQAVTDRPRAAVYLGSISTDRGSHVLCDLVEHESLPAGWSVVLAGRIVDDAAGPRVERLARTGVLEHRGVLSPEAARDLLTAARVGLLPLLPTPAYVDSLPTKLFEYMAAGMAIIATDIPAWRDVLADVPCVTWVPAGDAGAIAAAVRAYDADAELLARHGTAGRAATAASFRWETEERVLIDLYASFWPTTPFARPGC